MLNKGNPDLIELRRERVAYWRLRGKTVREIVQCLADEEINNPETNSPFGRSTIANDCKTLRTLWKKEQAAALDEAKGTVLAELREVRAAAWSGGGMNGVVKALLEKLEDDDNFEVRKEAAKALGRVGMIDYAAILTAIKQESQLLGLDAPTAIKGDQTIRIIYAD